MYKFLTQSPISSSLIGGVCMFVGIITPLLWWLTLIGVWFYLVAISQSQTFQKVLVVSLIFWWLKAAAGISWFWYASPTDYLPDLTTQTTFLLIFIYWAGCAAALTVAGPLYGAVVKIILRYSPYLSIFIPITWVIIEISNAYIFSLITIGGSAVPNANFSFGFIGYTLAQHDWLFHTAGIAGVFGLSFIAVSVSALTFLHTHTKILPRYISPTLLAVGLITALIPTPPLFIPNLPSTTTNVAVVATTFSSSQPTVDKRNTISQALAQIQPTTFSAIIFPEDSRLLPSNPSFTWSVIPSEFYAHDVALIDSGRLTDSTGTILRGHIYNTTNQDITNADKQYLVPQGEFMPNIVIGGMKLLGMHSTIDTLSQDISYVPGPYQLQSHFDSNQPGILFCFESVSPTGVRRLLKERSGQIPYIAHPISHAWFSTPRILWHQQEQMLRVQARWNNIAIISAGNHAPSTLFLANGSVIPHSDVDILYRNQDVTVYLFAVPTR